METAEKARRMVAERGPRFAVTGTIRPGEVACTYANTADMAEEIRKNYADDWGYYQIRIHSPEEYADDVAELGKLGTARWKAKQEFDEATDKVRALVVRLVDEEALSEVEAAQRAQVDRMTIRKWRGKR
jgi:hypothetical protein